jgi:transposase-like protein
LKQLYCSFFGHDYSVTKNVTYHVKEYTCKKCKEQVTTNGNGKLTLLTPKYKEINAVLERIHNNRLRKKNIPVIDLSESSLFRLA